ncbi:uncharacterized protein KGF55_000025 [Candida pseudojiufengensis]|uniref:uncharacterized protein n=1 Tax=Candida pseudojiufengensis TaxID=497109 RepID=UPI00222563EC|nr:uncharacterized protein KGF55_000025 [Candida pseudojiufengensis]KAI5968120.1 hypothetical protein KGF55_000025 [Candida pseudojiufengensis]
MYQPRPIKKFKPNSYSSSSALTSTVSSTISNFNFRSFPPPDSPTTSVLDQNYRTTPDNSSSNYIYNQNNFSPLSINPDNQEFNSASKPILNEIERFNSKYAVKTKGEIPFDPISDTTALKISLGKSLFDVIKMYKIGFLTSFGYTIPSVKNSKSILNLSVNDPDEIQKCIGITTTYYSYRCIDIETINKSASPVVILVTEAVDPVMDILEKLEFYGLFIKNIFNPNDIQRPSDILIIRPFQFCESILQGNLKVHDTKLVIIDDVEIFFKLQNIVFKLTLDKFKISTIFVWFASKLSSEFKSYLINFNDVISIEYNYKNSLDKTNKRLKLVKFKNPLIVLSQAELNKLPKHQRRERVRKSNQLALQAKVDELVKIKESFAKDNELFGKNVIVYVKGRKDAAQIANSLRQQSIQAFHIFSKLPFEEKEEIEQAVRQKDAILITHDTRFLKDKGLIIEFEATRFNSYLNRVNNYGKNAIEHIITFFTFDDMKYFKSYQIFFEKNGIEIAKEFYDHLDEQSN